MPETLRKNGVLMARSPHIKCQECGKSDLKTIEQEHLQGPNCTGRLNKRSEYEREYPEAPVVTLEFYEDIGGSAPGSKG